MTHTEIIAAARDLVRLMKIRLEAIRFGIDKPVPGKNDSWVPYSHEYAKAIALIESMQAELLRLASELAEAKAALETTKDKLAQLRLNILKEGSEKLNKELAELELAKHVSQATMRMEVGADAKP